MAAAKGDGRTQGVAAIAGTVAFLLGWLIGCASSRQAPPDRVGDPPGAGRPGQTRAEPPPAPSRTAGRKLDPLIHGP